MLTSAIVLFVLQAQPVCWADRAVPRDVKAAQLETIADAIADASEGSVHTAALLLTIGFAESRWCLDVHAGLRRGGRGEGDWQLEGRHHGPGARSGLSAADTLSAARLAAAQLRRSRQCGPSPAGILTAYAGRPCVQAREGWPTLTERVRRYWSTLSALRRAGAE